jgi:WD40 repeat protein
LNVEYYLQYMSDAPGSVPAEFLESLYTIPRNRVTIPYLIEELKREKVAILAGYDVTTWAGLPRWPDFLDNLGALSGVEQMPDHVAEKAAAISVKAGPLLLVDAIEETYKQIPLPAHWREPLPLFPYLSRKVLTLSPDRLIEHVCEMAGLPFPQRWIDSASTTLATLPIIWKLNGTAEQPSSLLQANDLVPLLKAIVSEYALLIVGATHEEIGRFNFLMEEGARAPHYAVLPNLPYIDSALLSRYFIRPVLYPEGEGNEGLLIRHLLEQTRPENQLPPLAEAQGSPVSSEPKMPASSPVSTPPPAIPQELIDSCRVGECVLFAGAGLSARAGVPTWNRFLAALIAFAEQHKILDADYAASLSAALQEGGRDAAADAVVQAFGNRRELLLDFMGQAFPEPQSISQAHEYLRKIPFASVVTTNYDRMLEIAFPEYERAGLFTPKDAESLLDCLSQKRRFLLKLYGIIERPETLIFAPVEYRDVVSANVSYAKFIEGLFFSRNFFFTGLSLEGIQDFLSSFVFRGISPRKHFALVPMEGSASKAKADLLLRRYNIQVIPIGISETFPEVDGFLQRLSEAAPLPEPPAAGTAVVKTTAAQGIRKLILEDIGPFPRLELDFAKEWNWKILLGNNGVGKSTILKAIATAIIGSDARSYAARLVRAGATRGRITLTTEGNPSGYITEIYTKDMTSEAEVVSIPSRPMEAEGWLALGFSPLRVVTWMASSGAQAIVQKGRPSADDLVPLLSGEPDPRMDRLKQWIVNLDNAHKTGQGSPQEFRTFSGHMGRVSSVAFSGDSSTLVSGALDGTVKTWDVATGKQTVMNEAHSAGVNCVAITADGATAVSGSFDRTIRVWDTRTRRSLRSLIGSQSQVLSLALTADGSKLVSGTEGGSIREWNPGTGKQIEMLDSGMKEVWSLALSADGRTMASCSDDGKVRVWTVAGRLLSRFKFDVAAWSIALTPDGKTLVAGTPNSEVFVWDLGTGEVVRTLRGCPGEVFAVAVSGDGRTVVSGSGEGTLCVWEDGATTPTRINKAHTEGVWSVALSPDGKIIASGGDDKAIKIWSLSLPEVSVSPLETINKFFQLVGMVTDRNDIEFLKVRDDFRVLIKTGTVPDGVPMEVLSQGLTSLFGWIGVLCQRLKETLENPTNDALPTDSYALVLIDEIDAHMHPRWQQVLVHRLKKAFPNVQFIACTHSPLIVGGLSKEEVAAFELVDGQILPVDFSADTTLGRTDQILVGELFGLSTTLDPVTQEMMRTYQRLLGKSKRSDAEQAEFMRLGQQLEERIPPAPAIPLERRARELIEKLQSIDLKLLDRGDPPGKEGTLRGELMERIMRLSKLFHGEETN